MSLDRARAIARAAVAADRKGDRCAAKDCFVEAVARLGDGVREVVRGLGAFPTLGRLSRSRGHFGTSEKGFLGGRAPGGPAGGGQAWPGGAHVVRRSTIRY